MKNRAAIDVIESNIYSLTIFKERTEKELDEIRRSLEFQESNLAKIKLDIESLEETLSILKQESSSVKNKKKKP